jgi:two-component system phosphate regulon sensor histidine kinase PhoR
MAARLNGLIALEGRERGRIQSILSAMSDGVLVVDADGTVELANPAALEILDGPTEFEPGGPLYALNRNYELNQIAVESAAAGESERAEIEFLDSRRYVQVLAVPLPKTVSEGEINRSLVLLTDLTEMRRVETTRREFVSNASHELRTPVAAISAAVETLQAGAVDDIDTAREFLQRMADDTARMDVLIAEMLELSRLETGQTQLSLAPIDPATVIKQATDRIAAQASRAGIRVVSQAVSEDRSALEFRADQRRVVEALTNLIVNALRASSQGSRIDVSASSDGENVTFQVTDRGTGIDADHLPHIFERFYKADSSRSDPGSGLGLAIVKHIMEAHGGEVEVESSLGEGAAFRLIFPVTPAAT